MRRIGKMVAALAAAVGLILASTGQASATYFFEPGQPTYFGGPGAGGYCTGGYAVSGTSGTFILTDGHCGSVGATVYGTDAAFANIAYTHYTAYDTALISEWSGNDAYQIVVDPTTGKTPGTTGGKVVGIYPKSSLGVGTLVGKMGVTTGWTEGLIYGTISWTGFTAYCSHASTWAGDSGGPVWRTDSNGDILAVGITVAYSESTGDGCFIPIQDILDNWGAWLPVFAHSAAQPTSTMTPMATSATPGNLPRLDPHGIVPAVRR